MNDNVYLYIHYNICLTSPRYNRKTEDNILHIKVSFLSGVTDREILLNLSSKDLYIFKYNVSLDI